MQLGLEGILSSYAKKKKNSITFQYTSSFQIHEKNKPLNGPRVKRFDNCKKSWVDNYKKSWVDNCKKNSSASLKHLELYFPCSQQLPKGLISPLSHSYPHQQITL